MAKVTGVYDDDYIEISGAASESAMKQLVETINQLPIQNSDSTGNISDSQISRDYEVPIFDAGTIRQNASSNNANIVSGSFSEDATDYTDGLYFVLEEPEPVTAGTPSDPNASLINDPT